MRGVLEPTLHGFQEVPEPFPCAGHLPLLRLELTIHFLDLDMSVPRETCLDPYNLFFPVACSLLPSTFSLEEEASLDFNICFII